LLFLATGFETIPYVEVYTNGSAAPQIVWVQGIASTLPAPGGE